MVTGEDILFVPVVPVHKGLKQVLNIIKCNLLISPGVAIKCAHQATTLLNLQDVVSRIDELVDQRCVDGLCQWHNSIEAVRRAVSRSCTCCCRQARRGCGSVTKTPWNAREAPWFGRHAGLKIPRHGCENSQRRKSLRTQDGEMIQTWLPISRYRGVEHDGPRQISHNIGNLQAVLGHWYCPGDDEFPSPAGPCRDRMSRLRQSYTRKEWD